jgi:hypothetical protein
MMIFLGRFYVYMLSEARLCGQAPWMSMFIWIFGRTRVFGRGGSPEPPKAIAVNRPYLLRYMWITKALTLSADFVFDTRS